MVFKIVYEGPLEVIDGYESCLSVEVHLVLPRVILLYSFFFFFEIKMFLLLLLFFTYTGFLKIMFDVRLFFIQIYYTTKNYACITFINI